ncbi:hypothetical protein ACFQVD_09815 [Streptosporangium amethystogenes subsp. fukuiense]|uniref:TetR family transcriptional regulator n=1 Tax=Streptosporangium amethystogenes subsp. fukuiense TaxID=698418 RepID=A0ABW2SWE9_9ACTN
MTVSSYVTPAPKPSPPAPAVAASTYLYWPAKEDLILGLLARELLTFLNEIVARITADPAVVLPRHLAPLLIRTGLRLPLARRVQSGDAGLLRLLTQQVGDRELFARTTPSALCETGLPICHRHGLIRHDRPLPDLTYAVHAVLTGFGAAMSDPATASLGVDDPAEVLADTVAQLLEPPVAPASRPSPRPPRRPSSSYDRSTRRCSTSSSAARPSSSEQLQVCAAPQETSEDVASKPVVRTAPEPDRSASSAR